MDSVTAAPQAPAAAQPSRSVDAGSLPKNGTVVQAQVVAMLDANTARLAIQGQTIDTNVPRAFVAGTDISVAVSQEGGKLKLTVQQEAKGVPLQGSAGGVSQSPVNSAANPCPKRQRPRLSKRSWAHS